ncbi:MAG TPA: zinc ribbon domain-containing protein [Gemmatimonadaceae bacterium]|jgi:hypothetical protein|nr:zinc ribbon domain-containing protein [Gemmatimonadaceae bacterium]
MDHLDRTYQHLVRTIRSRFPQYESHPFDVAELYQTILPYRHHRRDLGLDTNDDYEMALTELLSGAREYLIVDERMRDALKTTLAATNPDPSAFKQFSDASVALSPAALRRLDGASAERSSPPQSPPPPPSSSRPVPRGAAPIAAPTAAATAPVTPATVKLPSPIVANRSGERCGACNGVLPTGREITFCPHCGQNLTRQDCLACGAELELGWKFCPVCGRPVSGARS